MKLIETLRNIGFSEKEALIYLELVRLGPQSASVLARHSKINRTTTYDILEGLMQRGLVQSVRKKGSTRFQALHPEELIHFFEREKRETVQRLKRYQNTVEDILPELISLKHAETQKPKVTFYEGAKGMREAYEDTLTSEDEILAYANVEDMHQGLPHFFPEYYQRRGVEKNIHIKAIMPNNKSSVQRASLDKKENRESVLIDQKEFNFSPEINIYNNKVLIASWREKLAIIIESKEIADFHRKMYKLAWERAKQIEGEEES